MSKAQLKREIEALRREGFKSIRIASLDGVAFALKADDYFICFRCQNRKYIFDGSRYIPK